MKRHALISVLFFCFMTIYSSVMGQAKIVFDKQDHDFGAFDEKVGIVTCTFNFKNEGDSPLIINDVIVSCGCTTPEWTQQPIAPGNKGFIKVSYNPKGRPGAFNKPITVQTNSEIASIILRVSGVVNPKPPTIADMYPMKMGPLRTRTTHMVIPGIKQTDVLSDSIEVINDSRKATVVKFLTPPENITVRAEPRTLKAGEKGLIIITFDARKLGEVYGFVSQRIYLDINGKAEFMNAITVSTTVVEDFSHLSSDELAEAPVITFNAYSHNFGTVKEGEKPEYVFIIKNDGKRDLILRDVQTSCGCTAATPGKMVVGAGESVPLKVIFDTSGRQGRQNKSVTVISNDPERPTNILRITMNVTGRS